MTNHILQAHLGLKIFAGMVIGVLFALYVPVNDTILEWLILPGDIFMALLKMVIVPLVLSSVILGVASAGSLGVLRSMGMRIIPYFIGTTAIAITIGITLISLVEHYVIIDVDNENLKPIVTDTLSNLSIPDRIMNVIPINPAEAELQKNMLQLVVMGVIIGIALLSIKTAAAKTTKDIIEFTQDACMMIVSWAMWIAPIAVFSLIVKAITAMGTSALSGMGVYMACVIGGLFIMFCVYMIIVWVIARRNPFHFLISIRTALAVAFSTSSSAATMPVSLSVAEERLNIDDDVRGFVIPLGATINMDGTALYQATAALFLCHVFGIDLSMGETILLLLTTIGASIGTPALPGVGLIVLATILSGLGVPSMGIALILGVDRLLDMCRTTINVTGDLTATAVMQRWIHR